MIYQWEEAIPIFTFHTYCKSNPDVQGSYFLSKNTEHFLSFWKLVQVKLYHLVKTNIDLKMQILINSTQQGYCYSLISMC